MKSPFDYSGFVGDGIADDTIALQSALDDTMNGWLDFSGVAQAKITATLVLSKPKVITGLGGKPSIVFVQAASGAAKPALRIVAGAEGARLSGMKFKYQWGTSVAGGFAGAVSVECDCVRLDDLTIDGTAGSAPPGARVHGVYIMNSDVAVCDCHISGVSGYGIAGGPQAAGLSVRDILVRDSTVTAFGDYGVSFNNVAGATLERLRIENVTVDMSAEPTSSTKVAVFLGSFSPPVFTRDVLVSGCTILATWQPAGTGNGSVTLGNVVGGRVCNNHFTGGGIGVSVSIGYATTVVGNTFDMAGAFNSSQGHIGEAIELAGSEIACVGNAIEGHAQLHVGIAIQGAAAIGNVTSGPNMIQGATNRMSQTASPGPFHVVDP